MKKKLLIIDARFFDIAQSELGKDYEIIPSAECKNIASEIAYHPDMVLFPLADDTYVAEPTVFPYYAKMLSPYGVKLVQGETVLTGNYPMDIAYNIAKVGNHVIGKYSSTDAVIKTCLTEQNVTYINVSQGYAKCSACVVNEESIITADMSIYQNAVKHGLDALLIEAGGIRLPGYSYGFIGGAGGLLENKTFLFFGDITEHKNYREIQQFFDKKQVRLTWIKNLPLTDVGTVMSIDI